MKILDLAFKGKVTLPLEKEQNFLKDFEDLLVKHEAYFDGIIRSYEFDECEIVEEIEEVRS